MAGNKETSYEVEMLEQMPNSQLSTRHCLRVDFRPALPFEELCRCLCFGRVTRFDLVVERLQGYLKSS